MVPCRHLNAARLKTLLLLIVMPTDIKDGGQKKYYDSMAVYELDELYYTGASLFVYVLHALTTHICRR